MIDVYAGLLSGVIKEFSNKSSTYDFTVMYSKGIFLYIDNITKTFKPTCSLTELKSWCYDDYELAC